MLATSLLVLILVLSFSVALYRKDKKLLKAGLEVSLQNIKKHILLTLSIFILMSYIQLLVPESLIRTYLGDSVGIPGVLIAGLIGTLIPSGPYVVFPLALTLFENGAGLSSVLAFIIGWMMLNPSRLPYELTTFNSRFTVKRYVVFFATYVIVLFMILILPL